MSSYYGQLRRDVLALLPQNFHPTTVLDVGCGEGATAAFVKTTYGAAQVVGVEINAAAAAVARGRLDRVIEASIESPLDLPADGFDLILCLDVLEHLRDPWQTLARLAGCLKNDGLLLISLPNLQHWSVVFNLLRGRWEYTDAGLLDRTHLRFFTERTARQMIAGAGLHVVEFKRSMGYKGRMLNALTIGCFRSFLAYHLYYLVRRART